MAERRKRGRGKLVLALLVVMQLVAWMGFLYVNVTLHGETASAYVPHEYQTSFTDSVDDAASTDLQAIATVTPALVALADTPTAAATPTSRVTDKPTATSSPIPTAASTWKTLTNFTVGVSFSYPDYFKYGLQESEAMEGIQIASFDLNKDYGQEMPAGLKMEVFKEINQEGIPLADWAGMHINNISEGAYFKPTNVGGIDGIMRYSQVNDLADLLIFVPKGGSVYMINISGFASEYEAHKDALHKMLDTMRFSG